MQKILLFSSVALLFMVMAFKPLNSLDNVISALKSGDAQELSKYIDDNIEISLPEKSDNYSKAQATMVLRDFFSTNGSKGFEVKFKGENAGNEYCIGELLTNSGSYRTTVLMQSKNNRQLIKKIHFKAN